jgi:hypothetical protein
MDVNFFASIDGTIPSIFVQYVCLSYNTYPLISKNITVKLSLLRIDIFNSDFLSFFVY